MLVFRTQDRKDDSATMKYTHPSTAAVAHVTVTTDNYESELPGSPEGGRLPPLAPGTRGFSSSIEYGGDGSPRRSSLRNSSISDPFSPRSPRVTFEGSVPIDTRPSESRQSFTEDGGQARASSFGNRGSVDADPARQSLGASADTGASDQRASSDATAAKTSTTGLKDTVAAGSRPSTAEGDAGRASQAAEASTAPPTSMEEPRKSEDAGERASTDNTSKNNPRSNVNTNATEPQNTGNVFARFYRRLFHRKRRESQNDDVAAAAATSESAIVNTNVNNDVVFDPRHGISASIPPPTTPAGDPTPSTSSGARAALPPVVEDQDPFIDEQGADVVDGSEYDDDDDDDDDDETASTESDNDTNNEYTRLLRHRRQPLPDLSTLCRTSFRGRTLGGSAWSHRPLYSQVKSPARRHYDTRGIGATSSD